MSQFTCDPVIRNTSHNTLF